MHEPVTTIDVVTPLDGVFDDIDVTDLSAIISYEVTAHPPCHWGGGVDLEPQYVADNFEEVWKRLVEKVRVGYGRWCRQAIKDGYGQAINTVWEDE